MAVQCAKSLRDDAPIDKSTTERFKSWLNTMLLCSDHVLLACGFCCGNGRRLTGLLPKAATDFTAELSNPLEKADAEEPAGDDDESAEEEEGGDDDAGEEEGDDDDEAEAGGDDDEAAGDDDLPEDGDEVKILMNGHPLGEASYMSDYLEESTLGAAVPPTDSPTQWPTGSAAETAEALERAAVQYKSRCAEPTLCQAAFPMQCAWQCCQSYIVDESSCDLCLKSACMHPDGPAAAASNPQAMDPQQLLVQAAAAFANQPGAKTAPAAEGDDDEGQVEKRAD